MAGRAGPYPIPVTFRLAGIWAYLAVGARVRGGGADSRPRWGNCSPNSPRNCLPRRCPGSSESGFRGALMGGLMSGPLSGSGRGLARGCGGCPGRSSAGRWTGSWGSGSQDCDAGGYQSGSADCLQSCLWSGVLWPGVFGFGFWVLDFGLEDGGIRMAAGCELLAVGCKLSVVSGRCRDGGRCGARR